MRRSEKEGGGDDDVHRRVIVVLLPLDVESPVSATLQEEHYDETASRWPYVVSWTGHRRGVKREGVPARRCANASECRDGGNQGLHCINEAVGRSRDARDVSYGWKKAVLGGRCHVMPAKPEMHTIRTACCSPGRRLRRQRGAGCISQEGIRVGAMSSRGWRETGQDDGLGHTTEQQRRAVPSLSLLSISLSPAAQNGELSSPQQFANSPPPPPQTHTLHLACLLLSRLRLAEPVRGCAPCAGA
jgi:hypothetical protein